MCGGICCGRRIEELSWRQWLGPNSSVISFSRTAPIPLTDTKACVFLYLIQTVLAELLGHKSALWQLSGS